MLLAKQLTASCTNIPSVYLCRCLRIADSDGGLRCPQHWVHCADAAIKSRALFMQMVCSP